MHLSNGWITSWKSVAVWLILVCSRLAFAWAPTYGAEFTFTNFDMIHEKTGPYDVISAETENGQEKMAAASLNNCIGRGDCKMRKVFNQYGVEVYRFTYKDGWWFQIATDPGVVEIQTKPATLREWRQLKSRVNEDIFQAASAVGLMPHKKYGGGHIHLGSKSTFEHDPVLFRNFLVDFANHPELGTGIWDFDLENEPPLIALTDHQIQQFNEVVNEFDSGYLTSVKRLALQVSEYVYYDSPANSYPPGKYQAINVDRIIDPDIPSAERTVEIRSMAAQMNVDQFLDELELIQKRVELLRNLKGLVKVNVPRKYTETALRRVSRYRSYVEEAGLTWSKYKKYVFNTRMPINQAKGGEKTQVDSSSKAVKLVNRLRCSHMFDSKI